MRFNPHSHAGSDVIFISFFVIVIRFNPHSHAGSDSLNNGIRAAKPSFNPHSHAGSDFVEKMFEMVGGVSIHTPTRGVTFLRIAKKGGVEVSIHTPTRGVTTAVVVHVRLLLFQSTLPRGE